MKTNGTTALEASLDEGTFTLVEASAGTGKTWLVEAYLVRLVAEHGIPIEKILLITFTRAATAEMRARVRERFVRVAEALRTAKPAHDDGVVAMLRQHPGTLLARQRLEAALRDFDRASISTIHSFCQRTLVELAPEAGQDPGLTPTEAVSDEIDDVVRDAMTSVATQGSDRVAMRLVGWSEWTLERLVKVAEIAARPSPPVLVPSPARSLTEAIAAIEAYCDRYDDVRREAFAVLCSSSSLAYATALESGLGSKAIGGAMLRDYNGVQKPREMLDGWIATADGGRGEFPENNKSVELLRGGSALLANKWKRTDVPSDALDVAQADRIATAMSILEDVLLKERLCLAVLHSTFASYVAPSLRAVLARRGLLPYDAMLGELAKVLERDDVQAMRLALALRTRFRAVVVDEFQDTDSAQWVTLSKAFVGAEGSRLIAVGDPKQSIYSFRGAELAMYAAASKRAPEGTRLALSKNFRSDGPLLRAIDALWRSTGGPDIKVMGDDAEFREVGAHNEKPRIIWGSKERERPPLTFRRFDDRLIGGGGAQWADKGSTVAVLAEDCADECAALLAPGSATIVDARGEQHATALAPKHVVVLVRTNAQGATVQRALLRRGIAATLGGGKVTLYDTAPAEWIVAWLDAVEDVAREDPARRLALTPLVGATLAEVAAVESDESTPTLLASLRNRMRRHAERWEKAGMAKLLGDLLRAHDSWSRVLGGATGNRDATDLRHLVRQLDTEQRRGRLGPGALADLLRSRRSGTDDDDQEGEETNLELDHDGNAVRVLTVHSAKGLQFPVVLLPYGWDESDPRPPLTYTPKPVDGALPKLHLVFSPKGTPEHTEAKRCQTRERGEEFARLLYVAMTRAQHHIVSWVGVGSRAKRSPALMVLLKRHRIAAGEDKDGAKVVPSDVAAWLKALAENAPDLIGVREVHPLRNLVAPAPAVHRPALRPWSGRDGELTGDWRQASYSQLSQGRGKHTTINADGPVKVFESLVAKHPKLADSAPGHVVHRGGDVYGSFVHEVFEQVDFQKLPADVGALLAELGAKHGVTDAAVLDATRTMLPQWLDTPLHVTGEHRCARWSLRSGFTLRDVARRDRSDELRFDLPLGSGPEKRPDVEGTHALLKTIASKSPAAGVSEAVRQWAEAVLEAPKEPDGKAPPTSPKAHAPKLLQNTRGMLNGSIDLLFRAPCEDGRTRYFVCDYKSNAIVGSDEMRAWASARWPEPSTPNGGDARLRNVHYADPLLGWQMGHSAYHLQALFYTVATHRLLQTRLPGYREGGESAYDAHVGGHLYLFVRGMGGPATPFIDGAALGVWFDRWPFAVVDALDRALRGTTTASKGSKS